MALKEHGFNEHKDIYDLSDLASEIDKLKALMKGLYPVGSVYITFNKSFNPSSTYGGTWTLIGKDTFLMACAANENSGSTGGHNQITLTTGNLPTHNHKTSNTTTKNYGGLTDSLWPKMGWDHTFLGNGEKDIPATDSTIFGNVDQSQTGTSAYLVMRPTQENANIEDGRLHLVGNLKNISASGTKSVSAPYEVDTTATRTGDIGSNTPFDNRPQFTRVYMWRRTA